MIFRLIPADTFIWNLSELIDFLIEHQHQDIVIQNGTEGCCARSIGLYQWLDKFSFNSVTIETSNTLEVHDRYKVSFRCPWKFLEVSRQIDSEHHAWNKKSVFGTLYGRPSWSRLGLASHLLSMHPEISAVGCLWTAADTDQRKIFEISELWEHDADSLVKFSRVLDKFPCYHPDADSYPGSSPSTDKHTMQTERVYKNFLIDIVSETFTSGDCFFPTEKTVRPMLLKKPMIMMGSRDYLVYLRQMGFRTFYDFWDEDYDGFADINRYQRILTLIDLIAKKPIDELEHMYQRMQPILDHNYDLLMSQRYNKIIAKIT